MEKEPTQEPLDQIEEFIRSATENLEPIKIDIEFDPVKRQPWLESWVTGSDLD
jgi:hypothetical protein